MTQKHSLTEKQFYKLFTLVFNNLIISALIDSQQNLILINSAKLNDMRSVYVRHNIVIINLSVFNQRITFP